VILYATIPDHVQKFFDYEVDGLCQTIRTNYCSPGNQIAWVWDELPGQARETVFLPLLVEPRDPVGIDLGEAPALGSQLSVIAGVRDRDSVGGHASAILPILGRPDLSVTFAGEYGPVPPRSERVVQPTAHNLGAAEMADVVLELLVPDGATVADVSQGGSANGRRVQWSIDRIAPGESEGRSARVRLVGRRGEVVRLKAQAASRHASSREELATLLAESPSLRVKIETIPEVPVRGEDVEFRFSVTNESRDAVEDLELAVQVPDYFEPDTWFSGIGEVEVYRESHLPAGGTWQVEVTGEMLDDSWPWATYENTSRPGEVLVIRAVASAKNIPDSLWQRTVTLLGE
jgi:hypothetical protein